MMTLNKRQQEALENEPWIPVALAFSSLGYRPESALRDAAARLLRAPDLAIDFLVFAKQPDQVVDAVEGTPNSLFRPLPSGWTVYALMDNFALASTGAFLLAAEMIVNPAGVETLLTRIIHHGMVETREDGTRLLRYPPIRERLEACPQCGAPIFPPGKPCIECASDLSVEQQKPTEEEIEFFFSLLDKIEPPKKQCISCGATLREGAAFCGECGKKVVQGLTSINIPTCSSCGQPLGVDAKFCGKCGVSTGR